MMMLIKVEKVSVSYPVTSAVKTCYLSSAKLQKNSFCSATLPQSRERDREVPIKAPVKADSEEEKPAGQNDMSWASKVGPGLRFVLTYMPNHSFIALYLLIDLG